MTPAPGFTLAPGAVALWILDPAGLGAAAAGAADCLPPAERSDPALAADPERLGRRCALRRLLGLYCGRPPERLPLTRLPGGKPVLANGCSGPHFSVSGSAGWALLAFCGSQPLGIDLERFRPDFDGRAVAERYFAPPARTLHRGMAFFRHWTRLEALLKLGAQGLAELEARGPQLEAAWRGVHVQGLRLGRGLVGALALSRPPRSVRLWRWPAGLAPALKSEPVFSPGG